MQRVSPTEKRGRVHTSTVTIAVIDPEISLNKLFEQRADDDFRIEWFSGTGKGGQHRNKHQNSCRIIHIPTGLKQERQGRHREVNLRDAKQAVIDMLNEKLSTEKYGKIAGMRKEQLGSGERGDKTRTIRFQDNTARNHQNGRICRADKLMQGFFDLLW